MTHPLDTQEAPATNVTEALRRVMRDLPGISRTKDPNGGVAYAFRGIEAITKEAQGLCVQHGVIFTPRVVGTPEVVDITVNNKPWTDTRMLVEYSIYGPGGPEDCITVGPIFAIGRDNSDKGANKCMTQAFKYALIQTFMIADAKDDGDAQTFEASSRAENGNPYRVATLRSDVTPADVGRMRMAELRDRLLAADLSPNGTLAELRERLAEYVDRSSAATKNASQPPPGERGAPSATDAAGVPSTPGSPTDPGSLAGVCAVCAQPIPLGDDVDPGEAGVETEDGRLIHAGCAA